MQGPLKTLLRNNTNQLLTFPVFPTLYVQAGSETELPYDPFTKWQDYPSALEQILVAVRKGLVQIIYKIDSTYATAAGVDPYVRLSAASERAAGGRNVRVSGGKKADEPIKIRKVPFGKTADDVLDQHSDALVQSTGADRDDISLVSEKLDIEKKSASIDLTPKPAEETAEETAVEVVEKKASKKRASKKDVVTI